MASKAPESEAPETIPDLRIPSDDCLVNGYAIHRGQSIWVTGVRSNAEQRTAWALNELSVALDNADPDPMPDLPPETPPEVLAKEQEAFLKRQKAAQVEMYTILENHYATIDNLIADRLVDWDWTDARGQPLPKPDGTVGPLQKLTDDEKAWFLTALRGETRKNGAGA